MRGEGSEPGFYVVATPLGNLGDLSPRARDCLATADIIFAEDTRRTLALLGHLGIKKPLQSLHAHNESERCAAVLRALEGGAAVVLVSDAGTPAVSDPGALVVDAAHAAGHRVVPVAGPSALTAALSACGMSGGEAGVLFLGFIPTKGKPRRSAQERLLQHQGLGVLFESPYRLRATLRELAEAAGTRPACVCRELTKMHEEVVRGSLEELARWASEKEIKGEICIVVGCPQEGEQDELPDGAVDEAIDAALARCVGAGMSMRDATQAVSAVMEIPRRRVYQRSLMAKHGRSG